MGLTIKLIYNQSYTRTTQTQTRVHLYRPTCISYKNNFRRSSKALFINTRSGIWGQKVRVNLNSGQFEVRVNLRSGPILDQGHSEVSVNLKRIRTLYTLVCLKDLCVSASHFTGGTFLRSATKGELVGPKRTRSAKEFCRIKTKRLWIATCAWLSSGVLEVHELQ